MQPFWAIFDEILQRSDQKSLAHRLNLSPSLVHGWTCPPARDGGDGQITPFDRAAEVVETLRANQNPRADELFYALAERLGFMPPVRKLAVRGLTVNALGEFVESVGATLTSYAEATVDLDLDLPETRKLRRCVREVVITATTMDNALAGHESALECESGSVPPTSRPMPIRHREGGQ